MESRFCLLLLFFFSGCVNSIAGKALRVYDAQDSSHIKQKHLVQLIIKTVYVNNQMTKHSKCSGSVISDSWILTSAHCFETYENGLAYQQVKVERIEYDRWVILGEVRYDDIITHPEYGHDALTNTAENDLAVIKTNKPMVLSENLIPITLNKRSMKPGKITGAIVSGYGLTELGNAEEDKPRQGNVTVKTCDLRHGRHLLCSNNVVRAGPGDSGGSLVSKSGRLLGVTSASCKDFIISKNCITLYVDVSYYLDWIKSMTGVE